MLSLRAYSSFQYFATASGECHRTVLSVDQDSVAHTWITQAIIQMAMFHHLASSASYGYRTSRACSQLFCTGSLEPVHTFTVQDKYDHSLRISHNFTCVVRSVLNEYLKVYKKYASLNQVIVVP